MLIEFSLTNFRSICETQTLSLVAANLKEPGKEENCFETAALRKFKLLHSAAIYGPNASGKSNLLLGLRAMQGVVLHSSTIESISDTLKVAPFALDPATREQPSEFEVSIISEGVRYQYGFSATQDRIHGEWLFAFPKGRPQKLFEREWDETKAQYIWMMGHSLRGEKETWKNSTRDNALFLSTAVSLNSEQLLPVFDWFKNILKFVDPWTPIGGGYSASQLKDGELKKEILTFMKKADLDIDDIATKEVAFDPAGLPDSMPSDLKKALSNDVKSVLRVEVSHKDSEGKSVVFNMDDESDGTQRLFSIAGPWQEALSKGYVLFIDELQAHLHPHLVEFLVDTFNCEQTNPRNAQLVFTTHETSILKGSQKTLRRDQVWFCEKGSDKSTKVIPLSDFRPRTGEDIQTYYLSGRYGALPFISPVKE